MRKLLFFLYIVSLLAVLIGFYGMNVFTESIEEDGTGGGNGNPALFILVFLMPFLFYFLYGTTELSMRFVERYKKRRTLVISLVFSVVATISIGVYTFLKAQALRNEIIQRLENFDDVSQISLWNAFSNSVFFNPLTFILVILVCYIFGVIWNSSKNRRKKIL
ncbi:hypothetical protein [Planococcus faecalis]|uniref:DUF4199 domain-containing protein n=1 Tax=Planococcus faecalis TaxID=1598147 RepID=A0ABM6IW83_9BACL|nr:hypothetical protein [Planococcus faecalis]AQU80846.1 hypothetical protein AJGP001_16800 [Planococcus faecalis]OHX55826.1 hypothetical protein BB777_01375 [Planococcus faecalis]